VTDESTSRSEPVPGSDLYERLGGQPRLGPAVELFYRRVLEDPAVAGYFASVDLPRLIAHQKAFLTTVLGGPAVFTGRQLRTAHQPLSISDQAYDIVVDHLIGTLRDLGTAPELAVEVQERLEQFRAEVVKQPSGRP
jgi:hemoglobin